MITIFRILLISMSIAIVGCSSKNTEIQLPSNANISPKAQNLLSVSWPKIKSALPGIKKYGNSVKVVNITDSLDGEYPEYNKLTIELIVPEGESDVPSSYKAFGHHCFMDIDPKGITVNISKSPCKALLLDRNIVGTEYDSGDNLAVELK